MTVRCLPGAAAGTAPDRSEGKFAFAGLNGDPLHLSHFLHRSPSAFTTEATVPRTAKSDMRFVRDGGVVDVDHTGGGQLGERHRPLQNIGDDRRRQAVVDVIGQLMGVIEVTGVIDRGYRTK